MSVSSAAGRGHYAHVRIHVSPGAPGTDYVFANRSERVVPDAISRAVDAGIRDAAMHGSLAGCPVGDLCVDLCEASFHEAEVFEQSFRMAGAMAFRDAVHKAKPVLLEPVMRVEVNVPEDLAHDVVEDLARRRAEWQSDGVRGSTRVIAVRARMSQLLGYAAELRQHTDGRGAYSMRLDGYQRVER